MTEWVEQLPADRVAMVHFDGMGVAWLHVESGSWSIDHQYGSVSFIDPFGGPGGRHVVGDIHKIAAVQLLREDDASLDQTEVGSEVGRG